ncbi:DUF4181 domain-containing protein [Mesobacillus subterraneus]|uniref:DUF4181 domain-containing protein n=1 Tax=Mesobacillus subterraneus TaxID=285983 RepID=A0A3R9FZY5_9BACI|nr:DUF4181 domain-containing protein [Mesobacillus subterraneus]RSD29050.1 DUF4181 domain-containing protein [Mesobacillus subterraneus]
MGWKFIILAAMMISVLAFIKFVIRKSLKIPKVKKEFFSYNHINDQHRKIDWAVRFTALIVYFFLIHQLMLEEFPLNVFLIILSFLYSTENFVRAYFEWRHSEHPRQWILSLAEGSVFIMMAMIIVQNDIMFWLTNR